MDPQAYLTAIKAKLASRGIVIRVDILQEYATPKQGFFRARLTLRNNDFWEVAEFFRVVDGQTETAEYRFQWMDPSRQVLRKRWDNATHHPGLPNFPHHIHVGATGRLETGRLLSILDLVDLIEQEIGEGSIMGDG